MFVLRLKWRWRGVLTMVSLFDSWMGESAGCFTSNKTVRESRQRMEWYNVSLISQVQCCALSNIPLLFLLLLFVNQIRVSGFLLIQFARAPRERW